MLERKGNKVTKKVLGTVRSITGELILHKQFRVLMTETGLPFPPLFRKLCGAVLRSISIGFQTESGNRNQGSAPFYLGNMPFR